MLTILRVWLLSVLYQLFLPSHAIEQMMMALIFLVPLFEVAVLSVCLLEEAEEYELVTE